VVRFHPGGDAGAGGAVGVEVYYVHTDHLNTPRRVTRPADDVIVWRWQLTSPSFSVHQD